MTAIDKKTLIEDRVNSGLLGQCTTAGEQDLRRGPPCAPDRGHA